MSEDGSLSVLDEYTMVKKYKFCLVYASAQMPHAGSHIVMDTPTNGFYVMDLPLCSRAAMSHCGHELGSNIIVRPHLVVLIL